MDCKGISEVAFLDPKKDFNRVNHNPLLYVVTTCDHYCHNIRDSRYIAFPCLCEMPSKLCVTVALYCAFMQQMQ